MKALTISDESAGSPHPKVFRERGSVLHLLLAFWLYSMDLRPLESSAPFRLHRDRHCLTFDTLVLPSITMRFSTASPDPTPEPRSNCWKYAVRQTCNIPFHGCSRLLALSRPAELARPS